MNKKMYRALLFSFVLMLFTVGIGLGVKYGDDQIKNSSVDNIDEKDNKEDNGKSNNIDNINIYNNESIKTNVDIYDVSIYENKEDIEVNLIENYLLCHEEITQTFMEYNTNLDILKEKYKDYNIVSEDNNILVLEKTINTNCPHHYLVKILNEYVVVYQVISDSKTDIYKNTEIHINTIRDEIKEELKKGVYVEGIEELYNLIEELDS